MDVAAMKKNHNTSDQIRPREKTRREFIQSIGKLAVWVPPTLVVLSHSKEALAAQSWNSGEGNKDHPGDGNGGPS